MADVSRKQTTEQRTRLASHVIWKSAIFAWQLFCRMWLVAVIILLRYWRVSADSLCLSKKPPRIFPVYAFIYSEFSVSHFWQCRHLQRIAPSQENFQELSDTSSAWYSWETIELISSGAPDFDYSHFILFFLSVIFWGKKQKWNADNEFKKQGNWNLV